MSSTSNSKVSIVDPDDGYPVNVTSNGLKVDVGSDISIDNINVNLDGSTDSVECVQDTQADLNATVYQASSNRIVSGAVKVQGGQQENEVIIDEPIILGAENFGNAWDTTPAISANRAVRLITDATRHLYTRPKRWMSWANYGPLALDGTVEKLSDFGGGLGLQNDCYEIILQTSATNDGYVAILADAGADLDEGIRMDAGDTLVLPIYSTGLVYMKSSDATQELKVTITK